MPDAKTTQLVYDQLDLQRATQAYLSTIQISSMNAMRTGILKFGPANKAALLFEELMDSKALWLTPNTVSVYMASWLELGDEPMVIETPPNVLGFIDDAWFKYVIDFGNAGPDKGQGGKTPPEANADGSYDIYFGPKAPKGRETNWIQSVSGKGWNTIFRLYGPLESFYDQTWKPSDPELIE